MAGINLSQSVTEKQVQEPKGKSGGMLAVIGLFFLTILSWGGVMVGSTVYDRKIQAQNDLIDSKKAELSGAVVSDIADTDARLSLTGENIKSRVHPQAILIALEGTLLPSVRLTYFDYDDSTGTVEIKGVAPGYKEIAQQVMALKISSRFSDVKIISLGREKDANGVIFEFDSKWAEKK